MTPAALPGALVSDTAVAIDRAAHEIALTSGLTAITLRRMTSVSGLAPAVVAAQEPSMPALMARTFTDLAHSEFVRISSQLDDAATPLDALKTLVRLMLVTDHSLSKTIWADAWSVGRHNDFVAAAARRCMVDWQDLAVRILTDGTESGDFRVRNPGLAARQFFALIDSTTVYGLVGYLDEPSRVELVTRSVEVSVGLPEGTLAQS
jgi:hypothetical protein